MVFSKIAFRNIFRQRRRSLLTGLTMLVGFVLLSLSFSLQEGTYDNVIDLFTRSSTGHVQIHKDDYLDKPSIYKNFADLGYFEGKLKSFKHVISWTPRVYTTALAFVGDKTTVARVIGIDPVKERSTTAIDEKIETGRFLAAEPANDVMIGAGIADILKAKIGDEIVLISQAADGSIANDIFKITAIMNKKLGTTSRLNCYMHIKKAQNFLWLPERYHEIAIVLDNYKESRETAVKIADAIGKNGISVEPWEIVQKTFYRAMVTDKKGSWVGLSIIIAIVAIGVLNTVLMSVLERTKEFGILKALGTRPRDIFVMIVLEYTYLALISVAVGLILSFAVNYTMSLHGIDYPQPVDMGGFTITTMYGSIVAKTFLWPSFLTFASAVLVSIFPAVRAARIIPMKALRTN